MELRVLGAIEVLAGNQATYLGGIKQRALLAALLAHRGDVVSSDALVDAVWAGDPPPTATGTLQAHISRLRRVIDAGGSAIQISHRPPGYVLEVPVESVDADRFERGQRGGRGLLATDPRAATAQLEAALGEWRGRAFAEFADRDWARPEAIRLEELRLVATEDHLEARLRLGEHAAVLGELEALVSEHSLRERLWRQLMLALYRNGRQAEALRAAQALRQHLRDEFGLELSTETRSLEAGILADDPALLGAPLIDVRPGTRPAAVSPPGGAVPVSPTPLIGRGEDLGRLSRALSSSHLLTLTGVGGVGKSRLAVEVARREQSRFVDGVRLVELATIRTGGEVEAVVAAALDVERRRARSLQDSIVEMLRPLDVLLVIDNCEHVLDALSAVVNRILSWCPSVRVLATSREPIGIPGEVVWPIVPLGVPSSSRATLADLAVAPAVDLFVSRAREASPSFTFSESIRETVAEICIRLDGVPLALELAAARMGSMTPAMLLEGLDERFALLGSARTVDARHRTLRDVVRWSYDLLTPTEQLLFERLSVFAGGFDMPAAQQICGDSQIEAVEVTRSVAALVDKSMVIAEDLGGRARYRQLETLRQFGADRLEVRPDAAELRLTHARSYVAMTERAADGVEGPDEGSWMSRLEADLGNVRAAVPTAIATGDVDLAFRLTAATREFAFRRIGYELVGWAESALDLPGSESNPLLPTVLAVVGYGRFVRGELDSAIEMATRAVDAGERLGAPSSALPERVLGNALFYQGHTDEALMWTDRMIEAAGQLGVDGRVAHALYMRSVAQTSVGDPDGGAKWAAESAAAASRSGSPTAAAQAAFAQGLACAASEPLRALELLERAVELAGSVGNRWMRAFAKTEAMSLRARLGDDATTVLRGYRDVIVTWYRGGDWANQWLSLRQLAGIFTSLARYEEAATLFGAVEAAGAITALPSQPAGAEEVQRFASDAERQLGAGRFLAATARGAAMRDEETVSSALRTIDTLLDEAGS